MLTESLLKGTAIFMITSIIDCDTVNCGVGVDGHASDTWGNLDRKPIFRSMYRDQLIAGKLGSQY